MKSDHVLKKQKKIFMALVTGVGVVVAGVGYLTLNDHSYRPSSEPQSHVDLPADKVNPQDLWMNRIETQNRLLDQKMHYLEGVLVETKQQEEMREREKKDLKQEIAFLKRQLKETAEQALFKQPIDPYFSQSLDPLPNMTPLTELVMETIIDPIDIVTNKIPSGTTVRALLVSSVDADCGTYSSSDPIPVKLRLLDDGHLPKGVDVPLKGGIIIGSAYGNLSSERVYMRLERLTQVQPDGSFIETEIAGYVSGEDGKYGVRGVVVDKSEKIVKNAAISGLCGEAGQILTSALGRYKIDNYLNAGQSTNNGTYSPGILSSTASNAFDMLADYYIKRAEQIKPVLQINAGRILDITFTHGAEIGGFKREEQLENLREKNRSFS